MPGQIETSNTADPSIESIPDGWLKSPTFGFYYPQEMNIIEYYSDTSAVPMDPQALTADAIPTFRGTMPPDHDMVIIWGDHWGNPPAWSACTLDQYGPFVPGSLRLHVSMVTGHGLHIRALETRYRVKI